MPRKVLISGRGRKRSTEAIAAKKMSSQAGVGPTHLRALRKQSSKVTAQKPIVTPCTPTQPRNLCPRAITT